MAKRIVITGGSGLIGRAVTRELVDAGWEVVWLSRRPQRLQNLPNGVSAEAWDARTSHGWGPMLDGDTAILNLAGENVAGGVWPRNRWTAGRKRRIRDSRLDAGRAVSEAITKAKKKPCVLLQASAVGYYGPRGDETITETAEPGDDFLARVCVDWEASTAGVARGEAEEDGVRRVVLRIGVVLSPDGGAFPKLLQPVKLGVGGPLGNGRQWMPWIHIDDIAGAIRFLLEDGSFLEDTGVSGPYNLTAPAPERNRDLTRTLGRVVRRPTVLPAPAFGLRLLLGDMADVLLTGQRAVPARLQQAGYAFRFPELEPALRDLVRD